MLFLQKIGDDRFGKEPYEIFNLFFGPEIIQHMTEQTNLYAVRDKNPSNYQRVKKQ